MVPAAPAEPPIKVLYVEGTVRSEYKFLKRALESDPNIEVATLIRLKKEQFSAGGSVDGVKLKGSWVLVRTGGKANPKLASTHYQPPSDPCVLPQALLVVAATAGPDQGEGGDHADQRPSPMSLQHSLLLLVVTAFAPGAVPGRRPRSRRCRRERAGR